MEKDYRLVRIGKVIEVEQHIGIQLNKRLGKALKYLDEFSHILVAKMKGSKFNNLQFHIYGAKVELMDLEELTNKDKLIIYMSGAMSNIIIMIVSAILFKYTNKEIFEILFKLNFGLAFFNLLPAYPLDGARIMEIILSRKITYKRAQKIISIISYTIAAFFILISVSAAIFLKKFNISLFLIGIIMIDITSTEEEATMYILMGNVFKKRSNIIRNGFIENRTISVYYKQGLVKLLTYIDKNRFNSFYVLDDDMKLIYVLNEDELVEALKIYGNISLEDYVKNKNDSS